MEREVGLGSTSLAALSRAALFRSGTAFSSSFTIASTAAGSSGRSVATSEPASSDLTSARSAAFGDVSV